MANELNKDDSNFNLEQSKDENETKNINDKIDEIESESDEDLPFNDSEPIIEQILNNYGYGKHIWKVIVLSLLLIFVIGIHSYYFTVIFIPARKFFELTNMQTSVLASSVYLGTALGSVISGYLSHYFCRVFNICTCLAGIIYLDIGVCLFLNIYVFTVLRILIGILLGIIGPMAVGFLSETLPTKNRSFFIVFSSIGYPLGAVFVAAMALIIMPNFETHQLKVILLAIIQPVIIIFLLCIVFLQNSPRALLLRHEDEEAFQFLSKLTRSRKEFSQEIKNKIIKQVRECEMNSVKPEISSLFSPHLLFTSVCLVILYSLAFLISNGTRNVMTLTFETSETHIKPTARQNIIELLTVHGISVIGYFLAGFTSDIKLLGRKSTIAIGFAIMSITMLVACILRKKMSIFLAILNFFLPFTIRVMSVYSCEVYPSKIKDIANGFYGMIGKVMAFLSSFIFVALAGPSKYLPYYVTIALSIVCLILVLILPYETHGRPLDVNLLEYEKEVIDASSTEELPKPINLMEKEDEEKLMLQSKNK